MTTFYYFIQYFFYVIQNKLKETPNTFIRLNHNEWHNFEFVATLTMSPVQIPAAIRPKSNNLWNF